MANLTRFDPFGEMLTLREAMNSLFEDSFVNPTSGRGQNASMPLDVAETKDAFIVEAALPGVKPEDLDVTIQDNVLTITGVSRQQESNGEKPSYHRVERRFGRVTRSISLPTQVQPDKVEANLNHGVLHLSIPKAEAVRPRKIAVNSTNGDGQKQIDVTPEHEHAVAAN
jgi:HSP20 family protein